MPGSFSAMFSSWRHSVYFRGGLTLLITVIVFPVITGCDLCDVLDEYDQYLRSECGTSNLPDWLYWAGFSFWFYGGSDGAVKSAGVVEITGWVAARGANAPSADLVFEWTPPPGATGFNFGSLQPENPEGPLPFRFPGIEVGVAVELSYQAPALPTGRSQIVIVDTFEVIGPSGGRQASSLRTLVTEDTSKLQTAPDARVSADHYSPPMENTVGLSRLDIHPPSTTSITNLEMTALMDQTAMLRWEEYIYPHPPEIPMTAGYCQAWADLFQDEGVFLAVRFPLTDWLISGHGSFALPLVYSDGATPHFELVGIRGGPQQVIVDAEFEYRPDRHTQLENVMPPGEGFAWMALGVSQSSPLTCPEDLDLGEGEWELHAELLFDLGAQAVQKELTIEAYVCADHVDAALGTLASSFVGTNSFSTWDIKCTAAIPLRVTPFETEPVPPFHLSGPSSRLVEPPEEVWLHHYVLRLSDDPVNVELDVTSSLGIGWKIYGGTWDEPDLGAPVIEPIRLDSMNNFVNIWLMADIPAETAGLETVRVNATWLEAPEHSLWTTSLLPIGSHGRQSQGVRVRQSPERRTNRP